MKSSAGFTRQAGEKKEQRRGRPEHIHGRFYFFFCVSVCDELHRQLFVKHSNRKSRPLDRLGGIFPVVLINHRSLVSEVEGEHG